MKNLKKQKGSLSREEQRKINGGFIKASGCGCTNAACANTHNGNGDSYCNGTFCCG